MAAPASSSLRDKDIKDTVTHRGRRRGIDGNKSFIEDSRFRNQSLVQIKA
jgi:hypothetical protein